MGIPLWRAGRRMATAAARCGWTRSTPNDEDHAQGIAALARLFLVVLDGVVRLNFLCPLVHLSALLIKPIEKNESHQRNGA